MNTRDILGGNGTRVPITPSMSHPSVQTPSAAPTGRNRNLDRQEDIVNASHAASMNDYFIGKRQGHGDCRGFGTDSYFGAQPVRNPDGKLSKGPLQTDFEFIEASS